MKKKATKTAAAEKYTAPKIEIIDIELTQNILGGSAELPDVGEGGSAW